MQSRLGEGAGGIELQLRRQLFGVALQNTKCVFERDKAGVAADFTDGAKNGDSAELFEDVCLAQKNTFEGGRLAGWKVGPDDFDDGRNFFRGKAESLEQARCFFERVGNVVPFSKRGWVFRTMANEDADVVEPGGGVEDVVVEWLILRNLFCEFVQARLMAEFVGWIGLGANVVGDGEAEFVVGHEQKLR